MRQAHELLRQEYVLRIPCSECGVTMGFGVEGRVVGFVRDGIVRLRYPISCIPYSSGDFRLYPQKYTVYRSGRKYKPRLDLFKTDNYSKYFRLG